SRSTAFEASVIVHAVLIAVLVILPLIFTESLKLKYHVVLLTPPVEKQQPLEITHWKQLPAPVTVPRNPPPLTTLPPIPAPAREREIVELKPPKREEIALPKIEAPEVSPNIPLTRNNRLEPEPAPALPAPAIAVRTNVFSTGTASNPSSNF